MKHRAIRNIWGLVLALVLAGGCLGLLCPSFAMALTPQDSNEARASGSENKTVTTSDGSVLTWKEDGDDAIITGYVSLTSNLVIPASIEGRDVIALADMYFGSTVFPNSTFADCRQLETVVLPDTMLILSGMDFSGCTNLRSINLPQSIGYIGMGTFQNCSSLESIELPAELRAIDMVTFTGCTSLSSVAIPSKVTSIGSGAFGGCTNLKSVTFSDGDLRSIDGGAFEGTALSRVDLPDGLTSIEATAFRTDSLEIAYISASVENIGDEAFNQDVIVLTDLDASDVRRWAKQEDMTYVAGTLNDYDNQSYISSVDYTGKEHRPEFSLRNRNFDEFPLSLANVTYNNNVNAGTASFVVTSEVVGGQYVGTFKINAEHLINVDISDIPTQEYVGVPLEPEVHMSFSGMPLVEGKDFTVTYEHNNQDYGTGRARIVGVGNFVGSRTLYFNIVSGEISDPGTDFNPGTDPGSKPDAAQTITMHRLYNRWTGEHFYTSSDVEKNSLVGVGWTDEGTGWVAPAKSSTPVYRLYNPYVSGGDHHYTTSAAERDACVAAGWRDEGVGWYSDDAKGTPLYRQYNPYASTGTHNYTVSKEENDHLVSVGWREEGVAWYGVK